MSYPGHRSGQEKTYDREQTIIHSPAGGHLIGSEKERLETHSTDGEAGEVICVGSTERNTRAGD